MIRTSKKCTKCEKRRLLSKFGKDKSQKDGLNRYCKKCVNEQNKTYEHKESKAKYYRSRKGSEYTRRYNLLHYNNITLEQYDEMFEKQNGVCAICKKQETASNQYGLMRLAVDHNHKTGKIRGLLCQKCNQAIGLMNENIENFKRTIVYLRRKHLSDSS